jgi:hypothetical protein
MGIIGEFSKVAPYLVNPLVLIGFCLFLLFETYQVLLKSGIISPLSSRQSAVVVRMFLRHALWVSIVLMILGFAYAGLRFHRDAEKHQGSVIQQTGDCGANVSGDHNQANVNCDNNKAGEK